MEILIFFMTNKPPIQPGYYTYGFRFISLSKFETERAEIYGPEWSTIYHKRHCTIKLHNYLGMKTQFINISKDMKICGAEKCLLIRKEWHVCFLVVWRYLTSWKYAMVLRKSNSCKVKSAVYLKKIKVIWFFANLVS